MSVRINRVINVWWPRAAGAPSIQLAQTVDRFLLEAGDLGSFRYYTHRNIEESLRSHVATLVMFEGGAPVAYGHLDLDGDSVWLGIAVAESFRGSGYGDEMMVALLEEADRQCINTVRLAVDPNNTAGRTLYEKHGFRVVDTVYIDNETPHYHFMARKIPEDAPVADTIGSLIDKLATINNKLFVSQDVLYEIRRMNFEQFKEHYIDSVDGAHKLWDILKKTCDLNFQRSEIISEVDQKIVEVVKAAVEGKSLEDAVQKQHKTY